MNCKRGNHFLFVDGHRHQLKQSAWGDANSKLSAKRIKDNAKYRAWPKRLQTVNLWEWRCSHPLGGQKPVRLNLLHLAELWMAAGRNANTKWSLLLVFATATFPLSPSTNPLQMRLELHNKQWQPLQWASSLRSVHRSWILDPKQGFLGPNPELHQTCSPTWRKASGICFISFPVSKTKLYPLSPKLELLNWFIRHFRGLYHTNLPTDPKGGFRGTYLPPPLGQHHCRHAARKRCLHTLIGENLRIVLINQALCDLSEK